VFWCLCGLTFRKFTYLFSYSPFPGLKLSLKTWTSFTTHARYLFIYRLLHLFIFIFHTSFSTSFSHFLSELSYVSYSAWLIFKNIHINVSQLLGFLTLSIVRCLSTENTTFRKLSKSKSKFCYNRRSVGQSVWCQAPIWGPKTYSYYYHTVAGSLL
jgi:hypothetical protein